MASRILTRLGAGVARSAARGHRIPAGHVQGPSLAGALGGLGISPAIQLRSVSDEAKPTRWLTETEKKMGELAARIQALERAGAMTEKLMELAERRAEVAEKRTEAAERRADAAEKRAEMVEQRMERLEHNLFELQKRMDSHILLTSVQFAFLLGVYEHVDRHLKRISTINALNFWEFGKEIDKLRLQVLGMKSEYMNGVLSAKTEVSTSSWRIVVILLSAFGGVTMYYLPYMVSGVKYEVLKEAAQMVKDEIIEMKREQAKKGRWF